MAGFANNILDLIKGLIILILGVYVIAALVAILDIGKALSQFVQSIGFGAIIAAALILLFILFREEF
jgi:hypothetical protein